LKLAADILTGDSHPSPSSGGVVERGGPMTASLVRDVMTPEVVTAEPSTPFKEIAGPARPAADQCGARGGHRPARARDRHRGRPAAQAGASRPQGDRPPYLDQAPSPGTGQSGRGGGWQTDDPGRPPRGGRGPGRNKLSFDVDDYDPAMAYPWMRP